MTVGKGWDPSGRAPRCRRCGGAAGAKTPGGLRCLTHAIEEFVGDPDGGWVPLLIPEAVAAGLIRSTSIR